jgi:hypothetical protein
MGFYEMEKLFQLKVEFAIPNLTERIMRSLFLVPAIIGLAAASAAADAPFVTDTPPPDYTIAMIEKYNGEVTYSYSRTVTHHGDWTRVDMGRDTEYYSTEGIYIRLRVSFQCNGTGSALLA